MEEKPAANNGTGADAHRLQNDGLPSAASVPQGAPVETPRVDASAPAPAVEPLVVIDTDKPKPIRLKPKQRAFLAALSRGLITRTAACESVHVSRQTFYNWINATDHKGNPTPEALAFQDALGEAELQSVDVWMRQLTKVGLKGWWEPVFDKMGNKCGRIWKYDSKILQMVAQKLDPSFRQRHEITGAGGAPLNPSKVTVDVNLNYSEALKTLTEEELESHNAIARKLLARAGGPAPTGQN